MPSTGNSLYLRIKVVWVRIHLIPMQLREVEIMKNITLPISRLVRLDDASINSLNASPLGCCLFATQASSRGLRSYQLSSVFSDDPNVLSNEDVKGLGFALPDTKDDLIFCFPQPRIIKEDRPRRRTVTHVVEGPPKKRRRDLIGEGAGCSHVVGENKW
ncbi:hypothetical protein D8674_000238 [Pyrus ussuriensis x Pyrus communis]|uniref:Uncharacterized protein n=1 Tax=Pyrus ussuriensis x Pyrus communis TaxID=2448454 RepID=A0A5N5F2J9_9ROSA|nr:hypothetical protein D8674_000238 [Pyrus ussuriensis x Pyrus communis]